MLSKNTKQLLANFADVCNYYLYEGVPIIRAEDLKERDSTELAAYLGAKRRLYSTQRFRDVLRICCIKADGARSLHEMLSTDKEEILKWVPDYRLNLIEPARMEDFDKFSTNLGRILEVFKYLKDEDKVEVLMKGHEEVFNNLSEDEAGVRGLQYNIDVPEGGCVNMCKAWDDHRLRGVREGAENVIKEMIANEFH